MDLQSSKEVLETIGAIYSSFQAEWEDENPYIDEEGSFSLHSVYMTFLSFFAVNAKSSSKAQLSKVAALLNSAVEAGGNSENAVSTCFLEHAAQVRVHEILSPLLSPLAKSRFNA